MTKHSAFGARHGLSDSGPGSTCKNVSENDGLIMQLVAGREDERERVISRDRPKLPEEVSFMGELSLVSPTELNPSVRVMPKPSA
jgi:hypothetical protein